MIKSFKCKETQEIFQREYSLKIPVDIQRNVMKKLLMIDATTDIQSLRIQPSNYLEVLKGKQKKQYSIRVNQKWKIYFEWKEQNAYNVEIIDYHQRGITVMINNKKIKPLHPGLILKEEFLDAMNISQYRLAKDISVSPRRINEIVHGERAISANTALRLGRYFKMSPKFWINLQAHYDLEIESDKLGNKLDLDVKICTNIG